MVRVGTALAGEAEAVRTDDRAVLEENIVAETAVFADDGMSVGEEAVADVDVGVEDDVGKQHGVLAEDAIIGDHSEGANMGVCADPCRGRDDGGGVDPRWIERRLVKELDGAGEREVGVRDAESRSPYLGELGFDKDCGCPGGAGKGNIPGVGNEGDLTDGCLFDSSDSGNGGSRVGLTGMELSAEVGGKSGKG
jgi:hypothetical protein